MYDVKPLERAANKGKKIKLGPHEATAPEGLCSY